MVRYFAFDLEGSHAGLLRHIRDDVAKTETIEQVRDGRWIDNPNLIRFFEPFGGDQTDVIQLSEAEARSRAAALGVSL